MEPGPIALDRDHGTALGEKATDTPDQEAVGDLAPGTELQAFDIRNRKNDVLPGRVPVVRDPDPLPQSQELGSQLSTNPSAAVRWDNRVDVGTRLHCDDIFAPENREDIKDFFKEWLNTLVNIFQPRLKRR